MLSHQLMLKKTKTITYEEGINIGLKVSMKKNPNLIIFGLGVGDPKNIFNTTKDLKEKFGNSRVFDVPCSENALTGIAIGSSLNGVPSVLSHQRLDFLLLSMDQLINSASKYFYMFGSQKSIPITIRCMIGRGWGQGPTHSQNFQSALAHFPGLKIIMPTFPNDAKNLMIKSIEDKNPVIILEHRWLYNTKQRNNTKISSNSISKAKIVKKGSDVTIVSLSYMTIEALKAASFLKKEYGIRCEIIDLISIKPLDFKTIIQSIRKTKKIIVVDTGFYSHSVSSEIISEIYIKYSNLLNKPPKKIAMPDLPEPTSYHLTKNFYNNHISIIKEVLKIMEIKLEAKINLNLHAHHDVPDEKFEGPF